MKHEPFRLHNCSPFLSVLHVCACVQRASTHGQAFNDMSVMTFPLSLLQAMPAKKEQSSKGLETKKHAASESCPDIAGPGMQNRKTRHDYVLWIPLLSIIQEPQNRNHGQGSCRIEATHKGSLQGSLQPRERNFISSKQRKQ